MSITAASVGEVLQREVDESHVVIAKHELQGFDLVTIAEIFVSDESEIQEIVDSIEYKEVKRIIAIDMAKYSADTDISWDSLEFKSLEKLHQVVHNSNDPEFHLKVAAMANRATRRHRSDSTALNPAAAGARVSLSLTERFVSKLQGSNQSEQTERTVERRIDIEDAKRLRASPKEVMKFLQHSSKVSPLEEALSGVGLQNAAA